MGIEEAIDSVFPSMPHVSAITVKPEGARAAMKNLCERLVKAEREACAAAVAEEREACAKVVENFKTGGPDPEAVTYWGEGLAAKIRERTGP